jgi:hypothetical protein
MMIGDKEKKLINLWKDLCHTHGYPHRKFFNPAAVPDHLPNIAIMERDPESDPDDYVVRLAGTMVDKMAGISLKGLRSSEFNDPETDKLFRKSFKKVVDTPCGASFYRKTISPEGREIGITMTILPFKGKSEAAPQILFYTRYDNVAIHHDRSGGFVVEPIEKWAFFDLGFGVPEG